MSLVIANPRKRVIVDPYEMLMRDFFPRQSAGNKKFSAPRANVSELEDSYILEVAVPGYQKDDISISIEDNQLVVSAKVELKEENLESNFRRKEFEVSSFSRSFNLNEDLNQDSITAKFENGILKIYLPKKEEAKVQPRKLIEIS
jgi:HSP20 family protein